jgi:hypothetical protein
VHKFALAVALGMIMVAGTQLAAQNDSWEPNNGPGQAAPFFGHISPSATIAGFNIGLGGQNGRFIRDELAITGTDTDYFRIGSLADVPTGPMYVYLNQVSATQHQLRVEVLNHDGSTVLAGPGSAGYTVFEAASGLAHYDGARVVANVTNGDEYLIRVSAPAAIPGGVTARYHLSVEFGTPSSSDGQFSNNFPGYAPQPGFSHPADATPSGFGAANAKHYTSQKWGGWDYYVVTLTQPASITVDLGNFQNRPSNGVNFDLYWVRETGGMIPVHNPTGSLQGASDSFPNGWPNGNQVAVVNTPNTSEQIVTPPLVPGSYYFKVFAWDTSSGSIEFVHEAGNYDISFTLTSATDDIHAGNDTAQDAKLIPLNASVTTVSSLKLLFDPEGEKEDWFKVNLQDGDNFTVTLHVDDPTTDHMSVYLYRPSSTPGQSSAIVDSSLINNTNETSKGQATPSEIIGTWGTIGNSGNTGLPSGEYLIRVTRGSFQRPLMDQGYSLVFRRNAQGMVNIAPDDQFEPNNSPAQAADPQNTHLELPRGLTTGLRAMNFQDWYRIPNVQPNQTVEVTLVYDADAERDLDIVLYDMNFGQSFAQNGTLSVLDADFDNEDQPSSFVTVSGIAGDTYTSAPPNQAPVFVAVQRWNSLGTRYAINVNVNNNNPLPPLRMNSVTANPSTIIAGGNITVAAQIENTSSSDVNLTSLSARLAHTTGADVSSQYTITGPTPSLPATIPAGITATFNFTLASSNVATNGVISVEIVGSSVNANIVGSPTTTFTMTGGSAPAPKLVYDRVQVSGTTRPGGVITVTADIHNEGTMGGTYSDSPPINFEFRRGGSDASALFTKTGTSSPALPTSVGIGQTTSVAWTFTIASGASPGSMTVRISGGGASNPTDPGEGTFSILGGEPGPSSGGGGGGCAAGVPVLPLLVIGILAGLAAIRRRPDQA